MSILSWNCQGLGRPQGLTIQRLREMRQYHFPEILFLMETKNCRNVVEDLKVWLGYDRYHIVSPRGLSGGLAILWKKSVSLDIKFSDRNVIDCLVNYGDFSFFLSCIYGEPSAVGKDVIWERLNRIGVLRKEPWCLVGDFNEIQNNDEKSGGPSRPVESFLSFTSMLKICGMEELDAKGDRFTWSGKRGNHWVQCCLDRCFGNKEWFKLFPSSNQTFMDKRGSDHRPVWVKFRAMQDRFRGQFRFDKRLMLSMEVKKEVEGAWSCARGDGSLSSKITNCRKVLSGWKKKRIFNAKDKINLLQQRLEWFESKPYQCRFMVNNLKKELIRAYKEEEMFWWQKSRDKWLTRGDRNTDFFHNSVKVRRSSN